MSVEVMLYNPDLIPYLDKLQTSHEPFKKMISLLIIFLESIVNITYSLNKDIFSCSFSPYTQKRCKQTHTCRQGPVCLFHKPLAPGATSEGWRRRANISARRRCHDQKSEKLL